MNQEDTARMCKDVVEAVSKDPDTQLLCIHCKRAPKNHAPNGKCLFDPTMYKSMTIDQFTEFLKEQFGLKKDEEL